ncbi:MAG TPA: enoyl-CoA hydratase-related protein, partial [Candidatus Kapabacteria bacterium]|nr:enoyl-CoA hydratase-related protein [Candidatus Kapabacteria bacterium]
MTDHIRYEKDSDNIVVLTMDMVGQSANTMNLNYQQAMDACLDRLEKEEKLAGVVITSAKKTFFAGGDLNDLIKASPEVAEAFMNGTLLVKKQLRRIEKLKAPVVAAINGAALGGGYEICMACNHRIAINDAKTKIGLPEVTLGLLPGAGGVVRLTRMLGLEAAAPFLMEGKQVSP